MFATLQARKAAGVTCTSTSSAQPPRLAVRLTPARDTRCKAGDDLKNHVMSSTSPATPADEHIYLNAYDGAAAAHAETARHTMDSVDFWLSDVDDAEVPMPLNQPEERTAYLHVWGHSSFVVGPETSRNSLDSMDMYLE